MSRVSEIICIQCPLGCTITISCDEESKPKRFDGFQCKEGIKYAKQEYSCPVRVLTTTVRTLGCVRPVLPVRSDKPIKKDMIRKCAKFLSDTRVQPPLYLGDIIIPNILNTGANIVCTDDLIR